MNPPGEKSQDEIGYILVGRKWRKGYLMSAVAEEVAACWSLSGGCNIKWERFSKETNLEESGCGEIHNQEAKWDGKLRLNLETYLQI